MCTSRSVLLDGSWILSARHWLPFGEGFGGKYFSRWVGGLHPVPSILLPTALPCHNNGTLCPIVLAQALRISWALCLRDSQLQLCPVQHTNKVQEPASLRRLHLSLPTAHQHWGQSGVHWVFYFRHKLPMALFLVMRVITPLFSCQEIFPVHGIYRSRLCCLTHSQEVSSFMAWHFTVKCAGLKLKAVLWRMRAKG